MATKLTESVSAVSNSDLQITYMDGDLNIIQKLDDEPNDVGGLTAAQLKAKFDEGPNIIKDFINDSLIPEILAAGATEKARAQAEASRQTAEAARVAAEEERVAAEATRESAETERIAEFAAMAKQIISATTEATKAADTVNGMTVDAETSQPGSPVSVEKSTNPNGSIHLAFQIPKGEKGDPGRDGSGIGDMLKEDYDASGVVSAKGGITAYVEETTAKKSHAATHTASGTDPITPAAIGAAKATDVYVKSQTMKDTTAEQYGLDSSAVPDDILSWLGRYNEHWWSALHGEASSRYVDQRTQFTTPDDAYACFYVYENSRSQWYASYKPTYGDGIEIDQSTGAITLKNPQTYDFTDGGSTVPDIKAIAEEMRSLLAGKYVSGLGKFGRSALNSSGSVEDLILYIPESATVAPYSADGEYGTETITYYENDSANTPYKAVFIGSWENTSPAAQQVSAVLEVTPAGETTYEHSLDRNAYPDSGEQDGGTYTYLGVPYENFVVPYKIDIVSYIGTGVYGSDSPNELTFPFAPKAALHFMNVSSGKFYMTGLDEYHGVLFSELPTEFTKNLRFPGASTTANENQAYVKKSEDGKTLSWYSKQNASQQYNSEGTAYYFLAIG